MLHETLHAIRDLLSVDEAAHLAAPLPVLIRGIYDKGWDPSKTPVAKRSKAERLGRVCVRFGKHPLEDPERAVAAVFDLLRRHVSFGEFDQVRNAMRKPIRELWNQGPARQVPGGGACKSACCHLPSATTAALLFRA